MVLHTTACSDSCIHTYHSLSIQPTLENVFHQKMFRNDTVLFASFQICFVIIQCSTVRSGVLSCGAIEVLLRLPRSSLWGVCGSIQTPETSLWDDGGVAQTSGS